MNLLKLRLFNKLSSGSPSPTSVNEKDAPPLWDLLVLLVELIRL
jgi:hypothetical protein